MSFEYVGNGTQTLSVRGRTLVGLAIALAILAIVTAGSVLASSHVGTLQPGGGTITFAGGDVTVKAPDGATSAVVDIGYFPESSDSIAIPLGGANDSGQSGWATLTANGAQTDVAVTLSAGVLESELMHIHQGSCANPGGVDYPLTSFVGGSGDSTMTVAASLSSIRNGNQYINVHQAGNPGTSTACGDIPAERPAPAGLVLGSQVFSLAVMKSGVLQNNFSFSQFVSVTVKYSAADKAAAGGRDDNVALYIYDTASGSWIEIGSALPNVIDQTLTLSQQTLGTYAIVLDTGGVIPAPTAAPVDTTTPPDTGDFGVSTGMMLALGLVGVFFVLGGGYMVARGRRSN